MTSQRFVQVWVIQNKHDGLFLTPHLFWARPLNKAGRCYDIESARDTAEMNCAGDDYIISTFWEPSNV